MYKIETHLHTKLVSPCGWLTPVEILDGYSKAGYSGIVVTDHLMRYTFQWHRADVLSFDEQWDIFTKGYGDLAEIAPDFGIKVYFGAEIRFDEGLPNDYLLYGCPEEILKDMDRLFAGNIADLYDRCRGTDALIIQAHPYRGLCMPANASYLDGIEIFNAHPRHDNRNHLAEEYARDHRHLIRFSGSDCHRQEDIAGSGILVDKLPENEADLVSMIKAGNFTCILPGM